MAIMADSLATAQRAEPLTIRDFGRWMAAEQRRVFLLCLRILQDQDEADLATQDTFVKAYRALSRSAAVDLDNPDKWLTRIAVNTCMDRLRSRSWKFWRTRPEPQDEQTILALTAAEGPDAEQQLLAQEIRRRLAQAIARLSDRQRAVFTLKHYEDRTLEEIAEILQLGVGTVKVHMARAVAHLRQQLHDLYETGPVQGQRKAR